MNEEESRLDREEAQKRAAENVEEVKPKPKEKKNNGI